MGALDMHGQHVNKADIYIDLRTTAAHYRQALLRADVRKMTAT